MNKLLRTIAAGGLLSSSALYGQIEITDNLSLSGFIDMSTVHSDTDDGDSTSYNLDQVELNFLFAYDQITGQADLNYTGDNETEDVDLEQAFLTYDLGEGSSITAGKFLSYHGWETFEPTGLYQYSFAYELFATIPGHHNGISYDYAGDWGNFGIALLDTVFGADGSLGTGGDDPENLFQGDDYEYGVETKLVLTPADGLTLYFGYAFDSGDDGFEDVELFNFWTSYEWDINTVAFEYNIWDDGAYDVDQWLLMYSAAFTDTGTFTARVSNESGDEIGGTGEMELDKYTVAWIEAVTDNLALVFEYSKVDSTEGDSDTIAVEALFTF